MEGKSVEGNKGKWNRGKGGGGLEEREWDREGK